MSWTFVLCGVVHLLSAAKTNDSCTIALERGRAIGRGPGDTDLRPLGKSAGDHTADLAVVQEHLSADRQVLEHLWQSAPDPERLVRAGGRAGGGQGQYVAGADKQVPGHRRQDPT
ncbi:hypothetical protein [Nonomuraea jabiensis]|uniref:hypothetical protein n=1 Tax=Nonomuraea jabiensis TaxID=882448 RepID=UPI003D722FE0